MERLVEIEAEERKPSNGMTATGQDSAARAAKRCKMWGGPLELLPPRLPTVRPAAETAAPAAAATAAAATAAAAAAAQGYGHTAGSAGLAICR